MITLFLRERGPWILFFFTLLICMNIIFYVDAGFSTVSIGYFNIVTIPLFLLFLIWRYIKETQQLNRFLGNVADRADLLSLESFSLSPFQRKYLEALLEIIEENETELNESKVALQEDKEDLLAWVHEVKTPLTAMKLMIEQIQDFKMRSKLEKEWMRIHLLLDQQLHRTRIMTIEKDNRMEKFTLQAVVNKEIREFQSWCLEKGIGFEIENLQEEVVSDRKWLAFIIRQILSNAIKYSREKEEIHIYTERDKQGHLLLHFRDYGIGISQEDLPRIYNKSFTGTIGRSSSNSTGMGLYLAQSAAKNLGILISVESKRNEGSRFTLCFPLQNEYQNILGR